MSSLVFGSVASMTTLGPSDLDVSTLCLGTNVFGWTAHDADELAELSVA
jgi:aryl-alcohol dehydrogenase-like predicted oxidoreductase